MPSPLTACAFFVSERLAGVVVPVMGRLATRLICTVLCSFSVRDKRSGSVFGENNHTDALGVVVLRVNIGAAGPTEYMNRNNVERIMS
jgi:hypothetical protein